MWMADRENVAIHMDSNEIENKKALDAIHTFYVDLALATLMLCIALFWPIICFFTASTVSTYKVFVSQNEKFFWNLLVLYCFHTSIALPEVKFHTSCKSMLSTCHRPQYNEDRAFISDECIVYKKNIRSYLAYEVDGGKNAKQFDTETPDKADTFKIYCYLFAIT